MVEIENGQVSIIGAGPAGVSAAIQLKRYDLHPILLERKRVGGLILNANLVENYPGFPAGISGKNLAKLFEKQLLNFSIKLYRKDVINLEIDKSEIRVITADKIIITKYLIIASGTVPIQIQDMDPIDEILKERILYEVYPLLNRKDKKIIIVGGGDAAFDYALNLSRNNDILICNRTNRTKALPILLNRVKQQDRITYLEKTRIIKIIRDKQRHLNATCTTDRTSFNIKADYIVYAIGREPELGFIPDQMQRNVLMDKRIYRVGDVVNRMYRQAAIALGDGCRAAMQIAQQIREEKQH